MANFIVSLKDGFNAHSGVKDIEALAEKEKAALNFTNVFNILGVVALTCDEGFAEKIKTLPSVFSVEPDRPAHAI